MPEGAAATGLRLAGWDENTFYTGDLIRVTGRAGRNSKPMVSLWEVSKIDDDTGTTISNINLERSVIAPADSNSPDFSFPETRPDSSF